MGHELSLAGFLLVVVLVALRRRRISHRGQLWRLVMPSWRLFDGSGHGFELHVRVQGSSGRFGRWQCATPKPGQRPFTASSSIAWGDRALLAQLAGELEDAKPSQLATTVPYRLVQRWAAETARGRPFQFRLRCEQDLLISATHER